MMGGESDVSFEFLGDGKVAIWAFWLWNAQSVFVCDESKAEKGGCEGRNLR